MVCAGISGVRRFLTCRIADFKSATLALVLGFADLTSVCRLEALRYSRLETRATMETCATCYAMLYPSPSCAAVTGCSFHSERPSSVEVNLLAGLQMYFAPRLVWPAQPGLVCRE